MNFEALSCGFLAILGVLGFFKLALRSPSTPRSFVRIIAIGVFTIIMAARVMYAQTGRWPFDL